MRFDRAFKRVLLIPLIKITNASVSCQTHGSTGDTIGICDCTGYRRLRVEVSRTRGAALGVNKIKQLLLAMQSGRSTLFVSATPLSGYTSGRVLNSTAVSTAQFAFECDLTQLGTRKKFLNAKIVTSTTSGAFEVRAYCYDPEQFPPSTTGFTTFTAPS